MSPAYVVDGSDFVSFAFEMMDRVDRGEEITLLYIVFPKYVISLNLFD